MYPFRPLDQLPVASAHPLRPRLRLRGHLSSYYYKNATDRKSNEDIILESGSILIKRKLLLIRTPFVRQLWDASCRHPLINCCHTLFLLHEAIKLFHNDSLHIFTHIHRNGLSITIQQSCSYNRFPSLALELRLQTSRDALGWISPDTQGS